MDAPVRGGGDLPPGDPRPHPRPDPRGAASPPRGGEAPGVVGLPPPRGARRWGVRPAAAGPDARDPRTDAPGARWPSATTPPTPATPSCWPSASRTPAARSSGRKWLEPLLDGTIRSGFSMTEPGAGADPTMITTRAVRDGDEWVIDGHKWFTTNGSIADILIVMAVTNPDVHPYAGCSMIVVPADAPGVDIVRDVATMEHPAEEFGKFGGHAEIIYREVRVPYENLVGQRGRGLPAGPAAAGPRPDPPLHALAGPVQAGASTCCASGRSPGPPTSRRWPRSRPSRTGWPSPWPR